MPDNDVDTAVDDLIRKSTEVEMPVEVEQRLRRRLAEFRTRVEQRPANRWRALADALRYPAPIRTMAMATALLLIVTAALVFIPTDSRASQVFSAAAAQLNNAPSLEYTIVLAPYVTVDFSYLAPAYRRINCSWGIEVRTDGTTGRQLVLMHGARTYFYESGKQVESQSNIDDFSGQLRSMPRKADQILGERWFGHKKLIGYRLQHPPNGGIAGVQALDVWIDPATKAPDHVDVTVQEQGKPVHHMYLQNIRMGAEVNRSLFDLTAPSGYEPFPIPGNEPKPGSSATPVSVRPNIAMGAPLTAVVKPMHSPYTETRAALEAVESYLKTTRTSPIRPPFGRYESELNWEAGYPVPAGTMVRAPFRPISLPATLTASAVVKGVWGQNSRERWAAFLKSVLEQGYTPAGPAMEMWSGEDSRPETQSTEMSIPVVQAERR